MLAGTDGQVLTSLPAVEDVVDAHRYGETHQETGNLLLTVR